MLWKVDGERDPDEPYNIMAKPNPIRPLGICPGYNTIRDDKGPDNIQKKNNKQYNTFDSQTFKLNGLDVNSSFSCISKTCYVNDSNSIDSDGAIQSDLQRHLGPKPYLLSDHLDAGYNQRKCLIILNPNIAYHLRIHQPQMIN